MLEKLAYYVSTFCGAGLAFFGVTQGFEQPAYSVRQDLGGQLEIRDYGPVTAVETTATGVTREEASNAAFRLLFAYITGANDQTGLIAMTTPVRQTPALIAMTAPVRVDGAPQGGVSMRFILPAKNAAAPPRPTDPRVRLVATPAATTAALRYSGNPTDAVRLQKESELMTRLTATAWQAKGQPYVLAYDPPFTIPFLKRNEIVVEVTPRPVSAGSR